MKLNENYILKMKKIGDWGLGIGENQILTLSQDNQRYKTKYEDSNKIIKNLKK